MLEASGVVVVKTAHTHAALNAMRDVHPAWPFGCIVTNMKRDALLSGLELVGQVREGWPHDPVPVIVVVGKQDAASSDVNYIKRIATAAAEWGAETLSRRHASADVVAAFVMQRCRETLQRDDAAATNAVAAAAVAAASATVAALPAVAAASTTAGSPRHPLRAALRAVRSIPGSAHSLDITPVVTKAAQGTMSIKAVTEIFRGRDDKPSLALLANGPNGGLISYDPDRRNTWTCEVKIMSIAYSIRIGLVAAPPGALTLGSPGDSWKNGAFRKSAFYLEAVSWLVYNGDCNTLKQGSMQQRCIPKMHVQPNDVVRMKATMLAPTKGTLTFEIWRDSKRLVGGGARGGDGLELVASVNMDQLFAPYARMRRARGDMGASAGGRVGGVGSRGEGGASGDLEAGLPFNGNMQFNIQFCKRGDFVEAVPLDPFDAHNRAIAAAYAAGVGAASAPAPAPAAGGQLFGAAGGAGPSGGGSSPPQGLQSPIQRHQSSFAEGPLAPSLDLDVIAEFPIGASNQLDHLARIGQVVPFIGAGISAHSLPLWITLLKLVWVRVANPDPANADAAWSEQVVAWGCGFQVTNGTDSWLQITELMLMTDALDKACKERTPEKTVADHVQDIFREKIEGKMREDVDAFHHKLDLHTELLQGNFDLILTGNWDDFFERARRNPP